jgi:sulfur-oxidizing protein SoxX
VLIRKAFNERLIAAPQCSAGVTDDASGVAGSRRRSRMRPVASFVAGAAIIGCSICASAQAAESTLVHYRVENSQIRTPLTGEAGDPARGKTAVLSRDGGNCFLCHTVPDAGETPLGNIGPPLAGVGKRLSGPQLRLRLVDSTRLNRASVMPAYYRVKGLNRVAPAYAGKPLLTAQQIEDVIAYLLTLRN